MEEGSFVSSEDFNKFGNNADIAFNGSGKFQRLEIGVDRFEADLHMTPGAV